MNPAEDHSILSAHQTRVGRVNRIQWQYEPEIDVTIADPPRSLTARAGQRFGEVLIHFGERLLSVTAGTRPVDCGPC